MNAPSTIVPPCTERALPHDAASLRLLAEHVPVAMASFDLPGLRCRHANRRYAETFGQDGASIVGQTLGDIIGPEGMLQAQPHVDAVIRDRRAARYERRLVTAAGDERWVAVDLVPAAGPADADVMLVLITDITPYRDAEQRLRESEDRLGKFLHATAEGIVFHKDGVVTDVNAPALELLGYEAGEMIGRSAFDFIAPDQVAKVRAMALSGHESGYESAVLHKRGHRIPVEFIVRTMTYHGERLRMTLVRDLRDRLAAQARIHHLAHHDALTGMPNRSAFLENVEHHLTLAHERHARMALLFIDLDDFKRVNDSLGHLAGDTLLQCVAQRVRDALRPHEVAARFGGDEFVVLLPSVRKTADVEETVARLRAAISEPMVVEGRPITVTPSVGIAMYPADGVRPELLIKHADSACYAAKSAGRATYRYFDPRRADMAYDAFVVEGELAQAIERDEFELRFQPQQRLSNGRLAGAEALIRWRHPSRGLLMPDDFIGVAEERRLMLPMGDWVLRRALRAVQAWAAQGVAIAPVAVNLSTVQFGAPDFVDAVARALQEEGVSGESLEFELTERMVMDDLPAVRQTLMHLKNLGIRISIDDFGTGYTSLRQLKALPVDKLKIDRTFVCDLPGDIGSAAIVRAMVEMGHGLGMSVVAEGVETDEQRSFLANLGCDAVQGAWVGGAMTAAELGDWVRSLRR